VECRRAELSIGRLRGWPRFGFSIQRETWSASFRSTTQTGSYDAVIERHEHEGDFKRVVSVNALETKSRHIVKHDGSLVRLLDQL